MLIPHYLYPSVWFARFTEYAELIKLEHSIFALPFALVSLLLASPASQWPSGWVVMWVIGAMIGGRTMAMALNRIIDASIDAQNPRTQNRALACGRLHQLEAWIIACFGFVLLVVCSKQLPPLCVSLLPIACLILAGYSFTKRFTASAHWVLGLALACGVVGSWIALTGQLAWPAITLGLAVLWWVSGFDLIYACQDADFDQKMGLLSVPAQLGVSTALSISKLCHALSVLFLGITAWLCPHLAASLWLSCGLMAVFLLWEHQLVTPQHLEKIDMAFFTLNGWISVGVLGCVLIQKLWLVYGS
ncbi:MAG: UbiA-like polyprenyltransferase [Vampirovibrionales bacterium]